MEQDRLNDLMSAANQKLNVQKKIAARDSESVTGEDIYAAMKQEMANDEYGEATIQYRPDSNYNDISLQYSGEPEEDYDLIDDDPIFEGGPGASQVELWKKQFSNEKIFHTQVLEKHFVFRTMNRFEYKQLVSIQNIDALYREEIICHTCVLWPRNYNFKTMAAEDSGYPSTLAQIIMENSGFTKQYGIEVL